MRAIVTSAGILAACAVLVVAIVASGGLRDDGPGSGGVADPVTAVDDGVTQDPADPLGAARALTERRLALVTQGSGDLSSVVVAGSAAEAVDATLLAELDGVDVLDAQAEVFEARLSGQEPDAGQDGGGSASDDAAADAPSDVTVEVDYAVSAHRQRTAGGEIQVAATPRTTVVLVLRWTDDGWRVAEVR